MDTIKSFQPDKIEDGSNDFICHDKTNSDCENCKVSSNLEIFNFRNKYNNLNIITQINNNNKTIYKDPISPVNNKIIFLDLNKLK